MADRLPMPNLQGGYRGSCVVSLRGTDTALAFTGPAEWHTAALVMLGVPEGQALPTYQESLRDQGWTGGDDEVPDGVFTQGVQVCAACVAESPAPFPEPGIPSLGVPNIVPLTDEPDD